MEKRTKLISTQKEEIENQNKRIKLEKDKSDQLLLNVLPDHVVKELKQEGKVSIKKFVNSSVMFIDIVGFSHIAENYKPEYLVNKLNNLFTDFDEIISEFVDLSKLSNKGYNFKLQQFVLNDTKNLDEANAAVEAMGKSIKQTKKRLYFNIVTNLFYKTLKN